MTNSEYRTCQICGKQFIGKGRQIYCSEACYKAGTKIKRDVYNDTMEVCHYVPSRVSLIEKKEAEARSMGLHYADLQMRDTIEKFGRVVV